MVHISQMAPGRVEKPEDIVQEGQVVKVRVTDVSPEGKVGLSMLFGADIKPDSEGRPNGGNRGFERSGPPREGGRSFGDRSRPSSGGFSRGPRTGGAPRTRSFSRGGFGGGRPSGGFGGSRGGSRGGNRGGFNR